MERQKEIDLIRAFVIVALVFYHAFAPYCGAWHPLSGIGGGNSCYYWIGKSIISCMLEIFVFISGYLFIARGSFWLLLGKKFKRLIMPAYFWGFIYVLAITPTTLLITHLSTEQTYWGIINGIGHLWFLPMLFVLFILEYFLQRCSFYANRWTVSLLVVIAILPWPSLPFQISKALYYWLFFDLGCRFYKKRDRVKNLTKPTTLIELSIMLIFFIFASTEMVNYTNVMQEQATDVVSRGLWGMFRQLSRCACALVGVWLFFLLAIRYAEKIHSRTYQVVRHMAVYSFGVYLLHEIIMRPLYYRFEVSCFLGLATPWVTAFFVLTISFLLSIAIKKTKALAWVC